MKSKVLITGCLGLIGNHFCRYLADKGYSVFGVDNCSGGFLDYLDNRIKFYKVDICDVKSLNEVFQLERPDYVCHFAAYASEGLSDYIKNYIYTNNVVGSLNVINSCVNYDVKKILFTSSMAVMGHGIPPFKECDIAEPADSYGMAKLLIEKELKLTHEKFGLAYSIVRPHNVISDKYQNYADVFRNVLTIWINRILNNQSISIYGDGMQKRAFSDIKYCLPAFEKLLSGFGGEIFNIGADREYTILEAAEIVKATANRYNFYPEIEFLPSRTEVKDAYSDHSKIKEMLGFEDKTSLEDIVDKLFLWVKEQPRREVRKMVFEIDKNMYFHWKEFKVE